MSIDNNEVLQEQVHFLKNSCEAFDKGFDGEAKRMAVSVRVLVHDTGQSHSLFNQMGLKGKDFYSTAAPWSATNRVAHNGLLTIRARSTGAAYVANLDDVPPPFLRWTSFDNWWSEIVFDDRAGNQLTRRNIVIGLANKEGGAHVDGQLDASYEAITRRSQFWTYHLREGDQPLDGKMERVAMRQVAHEMLRTIEKSTAP